MNFHIDRLISLPFCLGSSGFCCSTFLEMVVAISHLMYVTGSRFIVGFFCGGVGGRFTMVLLMGVTPPVIALGLPNTLASETVHLSRYDWKTTGMSIIHSNWVIIPR